MSVETKVLTKSQKRRRRFKLKMARLSEQSRNEPIVEEIGKPKFLTNEEIDELLLIAEGVDELNGEDGAVDICIKTDSQIKFTGNLEKAFGFDIGETEELNSDLDITNYFSTNELDRITTWSGSIGANYSSSEKTVSKYRLSNIDVEFMFYDIRNNIKEYMTKTRYRVLLNTKTPEELLLFLANKNRSNQNYLNEYLYHSQTISNIDFRSLLYDLKIEEALVQFFLKKLDITREKLQYLLINAISLIYATNPLVTYANLDIREDILKRIQYLATAKDDVCRKQ